MANDWDSDRFYDAVAMNIGTQAGIMFRCAEREYDEAEARAAEHREIQRFRDAINKEAEKRGLGPCGHEQPCACENMDMSHDQHITVGVCQVVYERIPYEDANPPDADRSEQLGQADMEEAFDALTWNADKQAAWEADNYPHTCPRCGAPAYVCPVFGKVDCSAGCE